MREWIQRTKWRLRMVFFEFCAGWRAWYLIRGMDCDGCRARMNGKAFLNLDDKLNHLESRQKLSGEDWCRIEASEYFFVVRNVKIYLATTRYVPEEETTKTVGIMKRVLGDVRKDHLLTLLQPGVN